MSVVLYIIAAVLIIVCFGIVGVVLMQDSKSDGMAALGGAANESYFGKNKGSSKEAKLGRLTIILGIVFGVLVLVVDILVANGLVK